MGPEDEGALSEEDLKITPSEPETREQDIDLARKMAEATTTPETYNASLRSQGMGEVAKELEPGIDKMAASAREEGLKEKDNSAELAKETGVYIQMISMLKADEVIIIHRQEKPEVIEKLQKFLDIRQIEGTPDKTLMPPVLKGAPGKWYMTNSPDIRAFIDNDNLTFTKLYNS